MTIVYSKDDLNEECFIPNPFDLYPVVKKILMFIKDDQDLYNCRSLNYLWNGETDKILRKRLATRTITFGSQEDVEKFLEIWELADFSSFSWNFSFESELFGNFVKLLGNSTKSLDLSCHFVELGTFSIDNLNFKKMKVICPMPMEPMFIFEIVFQKFPFLVKLFIVDVNLDKPMKELIDAKQKEWLELNKKEMPSLKFLSLTILADAIDKPHFLSEEFISNAPNLQELEIKSYDESKSGRFLRRLLTETSKKFKLYGTKVENLSFFISTSYMFIDDSDYEDLSQLDFSGVDIKSLRFEEMISFSTFYSEYWDFLKTLTQVPNTLEELYISSKGIVSPTFWRALNIDNDMMVNILDLVPIGFRNLKIIKFDFEFNFEGIENEFLEKINREIPQLEDLSLSIHYLPYSFDSYKIWNSLKKLKLHRGFINWTCLEDFHVFHTSLQAIAPNLEIFELWIEKELVALSKCDFIAYPFFIWMGLNWKLKEFQITFCGRSWTKESEQEWLGLPSLSSLMDAEGNFTMKEITTFDFPFFSTFLQTFGEFSCQVIPNRDLLFWLHEQFPKLTTLPELNMFVLLFSEQNINN